MSRAHRRKRRRPNWPLRLCLFGIAIALIGHVLAIPVGRAALRERPSEAYEAERQIADFWAHVLQNGTEFFVGSWFLFLGAAIGSFLNVVVYRLPLGRSIVSKGSFCPHCRVPIKSYDNIPVIGWLKLRGRCRACRLPIASRYPIVEALVGFVFLLLYLIEFCSFGSNLPGIEVERRDSVAMILLDGRWDIVAVFAYHAIFLCILISAALIRYDGAKLPWKLIAFGVVFGVGFAAAWPSIWNNTASVVDVTSAPVVALHPVLAWDNWPTALRESGIQRFAIPELGLGLLGGCVAGIVAATWIARSGYRDPDRRCVYLDVIIVVSLVGLYLGWQSTLSALALTALIWLPAQLLSMRFVCLKTVPLVGWLSLAIFLHLLCWGILFQSSAWPGASNDWRWIVPYAVGLGVVMFLLGRLGRYIWASTASDAPPEMTESVVE